MGRLRRSRKGTRSSRASAGSCRWLGPAPRSIQPEERGLVQAAVAVHPSRGTAASTSKASASWSTSAPAKIRTRRYSCSGRDGMFPDIDIARDVGFAPRADSGSANDDRGDARVDSRRCSALTERKSCSISCLPFCQSRESRLKLGRAARCSSANSLLLPAGQEIDGGNAGHQMHDLHDHDLAGRRARDADRLAAISTNTMTAMMRNQRLARAVSIRRVRRV